MSTLPTVLEAIIERHGRRAVTDPLTLAAALRAVTEPPSEAEIAALVETVSTDALDRLRAELERGVDAEAAVDAALAGVDRPDPSRARWAVTVLGVALGLLPRSLAAQGPPSATAPTPQVRSRRLIAGAAVAALVVSGIAAVVLTSRAGSTGPPAAAVVAVGDVGATGGAPPTTTEAAAPRPAVDPRSVITDPDLFAFAEPYLTPDTVCVPHEPQVNQRQSVSCLLDDGHIGLFTKMFTPEAMRAVRDVYLDGALATPGSTRSLRWKFVPGRPGVRTGITAQRAEQGDGVRIRFLDQRGQPQLYFDQDAVACQALLGLGDLSADPVGDLDVLRSYWADPTR